MFKSLFMISRTTDPSVGGFVRSTQTTNKVESVLMPWRHRVGRFSAMYTRKRNVQCWKNIEIYHPRWNVTMTLKWRHNERDCFPNLGHLDCLFNHLFLRRSKKTSKLRLTGFCDGNSPVTGEFSVRRASNAEKVSIWWRFFIMKSTKLVRVNTLYIQVMALLLHWHCGKS